VGPGIAEMLDIPHVAYVKKIEDIKPGSIRVERMMEDRLRPHRDCRSRRSSHAWSTEINNRACRRCAACMNGEKSRNTTLGRRADQSGIEKDRPYPSPTQVMKIFSRRRARAA